MAAKTKRRNSNQKVLPRIEQAEPVQAAKSESPRETGLLGSLLLAVITLAVYSRSLFNGFIDYDDRLYVTRNPHVRSGLTSETLRWAFTTYTAGNWHPLTWISHALDVQMFGLAPAGHHLNSIIFHILNVVLLFILLWKATGFQVRSLVVAALFAVHPLNVECVAWAAERKSLLSTLLFFLALGAYGWYARKPSIARYCSVAFLFALGLMAKPMVITLPFVLLLLDYWPLGRMGPGASPGPLATSRKPLPSLFLEKVPLLILSGASAVTTVAAQVRGEAVVSLSTIPISWRIQNAVVSYVLYLFKAAWPLRLAVFYPEKAPMFWEVFLAFLFLSAISVWVWRERKQRPYLLTGWLWYLGTLVPVIGLVQVGLQAMADRYAYIPLIGIFVMLVWRLAEAADSLAYPMRVRIAVVSVILVALAALTWRQIGFWQSPVILWTHTLELTRENVIAEDNLGLALSDVGRFDEAIVHYDNSIRLSFSHPRPHVGLALLLVGRDPRQAIDQGKIALSLTNDPEDLIAIYSGLGQAYRKIGDYKAASESFQQVLQRDPSNGDAMVSLGKVVLLQAADRLAHEADQHPTADAYSQLGSVWEQAGEIDRAKKAYESALALNAKLASAQEGLERLSKSAQ